MNLDDLEILEALRRLLASVPGLRTVRLVRPGESVEIPLSRMPAALLDPAAAQDLTWPGVPAGRYHLVSWRLRVQDRAVPGTRAFESLVSLAENCQAAIAAAPTLGGLAADGPPCEPQRGLSPAVGAMRTGPLCLEKAAASHPTTLAVSGASGYWAEAMTGQAEFDGESLFASGPHVVSVGSPERRVKDQAFNGLAGGLALDLGEGPREILQTGVLSASSADNLALVEAAVEAFIDGRTYTLSTPEGADYPNTRLERYERLGPRQVGAAWHQAYRLTYRQLVR
jgi:hypothetical protein